MNFRFADLFGIYLHFNSACHHGTNQLVKVNESPRDQVNVIRVVQMFEVRRHKERQR